MKQKVSQCNGCGYCCIKAPCFVAARLYPGAEICPALYWKEEEKMHRCSLMEIGGPVGEAYRHELSAGAGCCSSLNSWRKNIKKRTRDDLQEGFFNPLDRKFQMFIKCWASEWSTSRDQMELIIAKMKHAMENSGYGPEETNHVIKTIAHLATNNKMSLFEDFIG